jgi:PAS domain S-box-containing protein
MRIGTQIKIITLLFGVILVVIAVSVLFTYRQTEKASEQERVASRIARTASILSYLSTDYLIYHESRHRARWQSMYALLVEDTTLLRADKPDQYALAANIRANQQRLKEVFDSVVSAVDRRSQAQREMQDPAFLQVSWSRMAVQSQGLISDASRLSQVLHAEVEQLRHTRNVLTIVMLIAFGAFLFSNYILTFRHTLRSMTKLQAGAAVIGSGNLDYRIEGQKNDEIGELAHAFNQMAADLKIVTASKADLEREIAERKQTQEALHESEKRFRELADAMPQLVWTANPAGRIDYFNRRVTEFKHQKGLKAAIHQEDWQRTREAWQLGIQSGKDYEIEHRLQRADGGFRWYLSRAVPVSDEAGRVIKWYGTSTDVNDRKQAEKALQRPRDELEIKIQERTAELVMLLEDLEKSRDELRKLASELFLAEERERKRIAGILHDEIAQTLAVAKMRIDMLQSATVDDESRENIREAKELLVESIRETRALMNDLGNPLLFEIGVRAACESLADRMMARHPIQIGCDIRDSLKDLEPDVKVILFQVVRELLNNVVKHSNASSAHVLIDVDDGRVRAAVRDDGLGFDPKMLGAPTAEGGFGLFSIRERLMAFHGSLRIESTPGTGTVVTASLPAVLVRSRGAENKEDPHVSDEWKKGS